MDQSSIDHLEGVLAKRLDFRIGQSLSRGIDIWKKDIVSYIAFFVIFLAIALVCNLIPLLGPLVSSFFITPCLTMGAALYANRLYTDQPTKFGNFFDGFDHWKPLLILTIIKTVGAMVLIIPFAIAFGAELFAAGLMDPDNLSLTDTLPSVAFAVTMLLLFVIFIFLASCLFIAPHIIIFYGLDAITSIKYSFRLVVRNWIWVVLFAIVAYLIAILGILAVGIGLLVTLPMYFTFAYSAFEELTEYEAFTENASNTANVNIDDMFR